LQAIAKLIEQGAGVYARAILWHDLSIGA